MGRRSKCCNAEVLRWGVFLEKGISRGSGWLFGRGHPSEAGESKLQELEPVSGFLFLLSWTFLLSS